MSSAVPAKTIVLKSPIEYGSETITELAFKKPKAKHLKGMPLEMGFDEVIKLAGRLCDQPASVMDELDFEDLAQVSEVIGGFLDNGQKTGPSKSD